KTSGSSSTGRAPSFSSRVKHSCRLAKRVFLASDRSRSENTRHREMHAAHTHGFSMRLNQPMKCVSQRRGMRLVSRKLMFSCCTIRSIRDRVVMLLSFACNTVRAEDFRHQDDIFVRTGGVRAGRAAAQIALAPAAVAREAPLARRTCAHGAALRRAGA